ncbi:MAG: mechanosensitive ion channel [Zoogloeaceae bacterium]|nr:mechanosensitive ion channel [Zoogloeaceae bacterium]MCP5293276.1 mechanosensitive ion channel [Zoogloeaceae bacterium]
MTFDTLITHNQTLLRIGVSILLAVLVLAARQAASRMIRRRAEVLDGAQRRQLFYTRSAFNLLLFFSLLMLWLGQVQDLLLSLTAVIVAVVLATKELIMCVSGFALRTGASSFSVGDWIEVDGMRGEVVEYNLLSTTVLELNPPRLGHSYTGNKLVLPNSLFLIHPVRNEKLPGSYVFHPFEVVVEANIDARAARHWLEAQSARLCGDFGEEALRFSRVIDQKLGVDVPGPDASVRIRTTDQARIAFEITLFCPASRADELETELTGGLLAEIGAGRLDRTPPRTDDSA